MKLRVAGVGGGYFAQFHYEAWKRIEEIDLVGVCDLDPEKAKQTALTHNIPEVCSEFDRLCKKTKPDLVDIITPPNSHQKLLETAFQHRIPVICQKPLAPDLKTGKETPVSAKNYLRNIEIEDDIYQSSLTQSRVEC